VSNAVTVYHFITKKSLNLFTALTLEQGFLSTDPDAWEARKDFYRQPNKLVLQ